MKTLVFVVLLISVFIGVAAYDLNQRGLLDRETLEMFTVRPSEPKVKKKPRIEPMELAASIHKKQQSLKEEAEGMRQMTERLAAQRRDLEAERAAIEKHLKELKSISGLDPLAVKPETAKLLKMYESMAPEQAAAVLENLPDVTVAKILLQMRERKAGQILESLSERKAADVTRLIAPEKPEISG